MGSLDEIREQALGWFKLLKAFAEIKSRPKYDLNQYTEHLWLDDVPATDDCFVLIRDRDDESDPDQWISVEKRLEPVCPVPPEICEPWLNVAYPFASDAAPKLREHIRINGEEDDSDEETESSSLVEPESDSVSVTVPELPPEENLEDHPDVEAVWEKYLEESFHPWVPKHQEWMLHHKIYAALFRIHRTLIRGGEEFELLIGIGLLSWEHPGAGRIRRHLLTIPASLEFEDTEGTFTLGPVSTGGGQFVAELDMLPTDQRPANFVEQVKSRSVELNDDPWNRSALGVILASAANQLVTTDQRDGFYEDSIALPASISTTPIVTLTPALILRPRSQNKARERIEDVIRQIENGVELPKNIRLLSGEQSIERNGVADHVSSEGGAVQELRRTLFPLPANEEQFQIVKKLEQHDGLLVQGPPGTGKSHTIANLICDQIAQGKRVLVTAQTERALKVLRDKLPKDIQPLCLSLLGRDRTTLGQLKESVETILHRTENVSSDRDGKTSRLNDDIESGIRRRAELDGLLKQIREAETRSVTIAAGQYKGTAQTIAQQLKRDEQDYIWFHDQVNVDDDCPYTIEDWETLRSGFLDFPDEKRGELAQVLPDAESVLAPKEFRQLLESRESKTGDKLRLSKDVIPQYAPLRDLPAGELRVIQQAVGELITHIDNVLQRPGAWVRTALRNVLADNDQPWKTLRSVTCERYAAIKELLKAADRRTIEIPGGLSRLKVKADAEDLLQHVLSGGRLNRFTWAINKMIRRGWYLTHKVYIDGRPCDNEKSLRDLVETLEAEKAIEQIWEYWHEHVQAKTGPLRMQVAQLRELDEDLSDVLKTDELIRRVKAKIQEIGEVPQPVWHEIESIRKYLATCQAQRHEYDLQDISARIRQLAHDLGDLGAKPNTHSIIVDLRTAIEDQDLELYRSAYERYRGLLSARNRLDDLKTNEDRLMSVCPLLAQHIHARPNDEALSTWLTKMVYAWNWSRGNSWLVQYRLENEDQGLTKEYQVLDAEISTQIGELASHEAWSHCNPTVHERRSLNAWAEANKNIRTGKGKYAARDRRAAQKNLMECRNAIPAWVLPLYRIYEQIDPRPDMFDVVIVDEASQCSLDSIFLLYIAKKIVIVGDDEQISPTAFINRGQFDTLLNQYLPDNTWASVLTPTSSLYAIAKIWFEAPILLREHFRCMPEIIAFSNDLCYQRRLVPLTQYPPDRLEPLQRVEVRDGYVQGTGQSKANPPEIDRVVETILACCDDPRYEGMTFGVISLLGDRQAKLIEGRLFQSLSPEVFEKRQLVCGNAYSFQGDERDVMFLTMVAARMDEEGNTQRNPAQTRREIQQRYNVAASRAKHQMWLFHSVNIEDVPRPDCLRHLLIKHFMDPGGAQRQVGDTNEVHLAVLAVTSDRMSEKPPKPFESWFEVDVFLAIRGRGYEVMPQYEIAGYRIDLVVHDGQRMLAVECDGDIWHGPEQFEHDLARQRQIERAGWTFWRIRGSEYYHDPEGALENLWKELDRLSIKPSGAQHAVGGMDPGKVKEDRDETHGSIKNVSEPESANDEAWTLRSSPSERQMSLAENTSEGQDNGEFSETTETDSEVLVFLKRRKLPLDADRIGMSLEIDPTTVKANLDQLVASGLVIETDSSRGTLYSIYESDKT